MSKHNYSQYSNKHKYNNVSINEIDPIATKVESTPEIKMVVETAVVPTLMRETVETVTLPETVTGVVANCSKLNVREEPDISASVICVLDAKSEVEIDMADSNDEWLSVCAAAGVKGYCMRRFVEVHL